jgi:hypothetical protein
LSSQSVQRTSSPISRRGAPSRCPAAPPRCWLLANGLVDELNLTVHPIAVRQGQRLSEDTATQPLRLVRQETVDTGVLNLTYAPA